MLNVGDLKQEQGHTIAMIEHDKGDKRGTVKVPVDVVRATDLYLEAAGRKDVGPDAPLFAQKERR